MNEGDETRARGAMRGRRWGKRQREGEGAVGRGARGRSDYVSQTPRSLVRPSHRYHHPPPFCSLQPPRNSPPPSPSPWSRPSPRLRATSSRRTLYGARTTLFVCFLPVCVRARARAYTKVCNFGVGNARVPDERLVRARSAYSYASLTKEDLPVVEKVERDTARSVLENSEEFRKTRRNAIHRKTGVPV